MIRLIVEEYCQECADFEPETEKTNYYAGEFKIKCNTDVYCKHKDRCATVAKWMKEKEGVSDGDRVS